jgi:membrane protease YdiL (CAAX protease family)
VSSVLDVKRLGSSPGAAFEGRLGFRGWVVRHPLVAFFAVAYVFSWVLFATAAFMSGGALAAVALYVGVFGPAIAAVVVTVLSGGSARAFVRSWFRVRAPLRWYLGLLAFPMVFVTLVQLGFVLAGESVDSSLLGERLAGYLPALLIWTLAAIGEEPGWRGFALGRLQERWTPVRATLVLGSLWALWHLPILAASDDASHGLDPLPLTGVTLLTFAAVVGYAFLYTFLYNRTRSVWLSILLHGSISAALVFVLVPSDDLVGGTYATMQAIVVALLALVATALVFATRGRLGLRITNAEGENVATKRAARDGRRPAVTAPTCVGLRPPSDGSREGARRNAHPVARTHKRPERE